MKTVKDWNAYVVSEHNAGRKISLDAMIYDYVKHFQNVKPSQLHRYIYKRIGEEYLSTDFDRYISSIVNRFVRQGVLKIQDGYISIWR